MLANLNSMHKKQERLIEIATDGRISKDELDDFINIQSELEKISITVEALQLWSEDMLAKGKIDIEEYRKRTQEPKQLLFLHDIYFYSHFLIQHLFLLKEIP